MSTTTFTNENLAKTILQNLWIKCKNEEEHCDFVLIAGIEKRRIPAHRSVLSGASDYFSGLFTTSLRGYTTRIVDMSNMNAEVLQSLVDYCYSGCLNISDDIAVELLKAAHKLRFSDVVRACENFLAEQLRPSNCFEFALLAEQYHCDLLLKNIKVYCLENFMEITERNEFLQLNVEQLSQLLACDDLHVAAEEDVFNTLVAWIQHDPFEREQHKAELLKLVRMPLLEGSFLYKYVKPICTSVECLQVYMEGLECYLPSYSNVPSASNLSKPRRSYQFRMSASLDKSNNKMLIHCYCPQQQKWLKWLHELKYREMFGVAVMRNCIYIVGGKDAKGNILNTVICLNLKTTAITEISPMIEQRSNCRAAALNGFLYAVGGWNGKTINSVEKWSPETKKWKKVSSMSVERCNVGVVVLNKKLYAIGGWSGSKPVNAAECYDPIQDVWQDIAPLAECYDPIQDVWQDIAPLGESRSSTGVTFANGHLYAVSGARGIKTAERYDPQTNKWTFICSLNEALFPLSACTTLNNKVVLSKIILRSTTLYPMSGKSWRLLIILTIFIEYFLIQGNW